MKSFEIVNTKSGANMGTWEAESAEAALDKYAQDAGYESFADACKVASGDNIEATECNFEITATESSGRVLERSYAVDQWSADQLAEELQEKWNGARVTTRQAE